MASREHGRQLLAELWEEAGADDDPLYRVALAHAMADLQDDPREELAWDLRAMHAADSEGKREKDPWAVHRLACHIWTPPSIHTQERPLDAVDRVLRT